MSTTVTKRAAWREATLGEILPLKYGKARSEQFGYPRPQTSTFGSNGAFGTFPRALTQGPSILVGRKGAAGTVHYSAEPCWPIDTTFYTEGNDGTFLPFFRYLLENLQLVRLDRSTAIPSLSRDDYDSKIIQYPEVLDEQRRIVAEIEKQFTRLEAGVAALRRVQANLKRYRAAVLKAACEGRLVPTEAELAKAGNHKTKFETGEALLVRILIERRRNWQGRGKYKEPAAPETTRLGSLPEGWTWATFEQIAERVTVGFVGSMKHEYVENGVPFLRGQNVRENRFDAEGLLYVSPEFHQKLSKSALRPGDLAVIRSGSVGVTCVIPDSLPEANCSDLVLVQRPLGFLPRYGAYYMNSLAKRHVAAGKVGVALIHFNTKSVAALAVPLPPLAEQRRIVAEVERRLSVVEELEAVVSANLQRATRLRQSILQKAFSGKL